MQFALSWRPSQRHEAKRLNKGGSSFATLNNRSSNAAHSFNLFRHDSRLERRAVVLATAFLGLHCALLTSALSQDVAWQYYSPYPHIAERVLSNSPKANNRIALCAPGDWAVQSPGTPDIARYWLRRGVDAPLEIARMVADGTCDIGAFVPSQLENQGIKSVFKDRRFRVLRFAPPPIKKATASIAGSQVVGRSARKTHQVRSKEEPKRAGIDIEQYISRRFEIPLNEGYLVYPSVPQKGLKIYGLWSKALGARWGCLFRTNRIIEGERLTRNDWRRYLKDCSDATLRREIERLLLPAQSRMKHKPRNFRALVNLALGGKKTVRLDEFEYRKFTSWIDGYIKAGKFGTRLQTARIVSIRPVQLGEYNFEKRHFPVRWYAMAYRLAVRSLTERQHINATAEQAERISKAARSKRRLWIATRGQLDLTGDWFGREGPKNENLAAHSARLGYNSELTELEPSLGLDALYLAEGGGAPKLREQVRTSPVNDRRINSREPADRRGPNLQSVTSPQTSNRNPDLAGASRDTSRARISSPRSSQTSSGLATSLWEGIRTCSNGKWGISWEFDRDGRNRVRSTYFATRNGERRAVASYVGAYRYDPAARRLIVRPERELRWPRGWKMPRVVAQTSLDGHAIRGRSGSRKFCRLALKRISTGGLPRTSASGLATGTSMPEEYGHARSNQQQPDVSSPRKAAAGLGPEGAISKRYRIPLVDGHLVLPPAFPQNAMVFGVKATTLAARWKCFLTANRILNGTPARGVWGKYLQNCASNALKREVVRELEPVIRRWDFRPKSLKLVLSSAFFGMRGMNEFEYREFQERMASRKAAGAFGRIAKKVRVVAVGALGLKRYDFQKQSFDIDWWGYAPRLKTPDYPVRRQLRIPQAAARSIRAALGRRNSLVLATRGSLNLLPFLNDRLRAGAGLEFTPESVRLTYDWNLQRTVFPVRLDQFFVDKWGERRKEARKRAERVRLEAEAKREAAAAERRSRTKSFAKRRFDVLGIRIGMTVDEATAALTSDSSFKITKGSTRPIFYSQSKCNFQWENLPRQLVNVGGASAAEKRLFGDTDTPSRAGQSIPNDVLQKFTPECRKPDVSWLQVGFKAVRRLPDGSTDQITVYIPGTGDDRTIKGLTRAFYTKGSRAEKRRDRNLFSAVISKKYGNNFFKFRKGQGRFWFGDKTFHNKAEFQRGFAERCLQTRFRAYYFRAPCGVVVAHDAPWPRMYMADTTFFHQKREAMERWAAGQAQRKREQVKF